MVVRWLGTGLAASLVVKRATRFGAESCIRWASSAATQLKPVHTVAKEPQDVSDSVGLDQPAFSTLEGRVSPRTLKAIIYEPFNHKNMSPVQAAVLPLLPELARSYNPDDKSGLPRDLLVKARTGTGKTLAFLVPAIEAREKALEQHAKQAVLDSGLEADKHLEEKAKRTMARQEAGVLILSPTRELATQIANEAIKLSSHHPGFEVRLFVGGMSKGMQMREWMKGRRDIVVGTPGRIRDVLENEPVVAAALGKAKLFILDEADTLLDMGFRPDLDAITGFLPPTPERQTFLFSATVSKAIRDVARQTLDTNHTFINCVSDDAPPVHAHIPQYHTVLPDASHQLPHILRLLAHDQLTNIGRSKTIVFLPTTKLTQLFATFLRQMSDSLPAGRRTRVHEIHSLLTQAARTRTSDRFRSDTSEASVLVSSDVSARGVDYPGVTRVIQVGIPATADQYVHRVGRTGRGAERNGRADLVLLPFEAGFVKWQLNNIPINTLSTSELQSEVHQLAKSYDSDPNAFLEARSPDSLTSSRSRFAPQVLSKLENIDQSLSALYEQIDPDAARGTVSSLMGYYSAKVGELRCARGAVLDGLMQWAVQACGLKTPPRFSSDFLARIGFSDENQASPRGKGSYGLQGRNSGFPGRNSGFPGRSSGFPGRNSDSSGRSSGFPGRDSHFSGRNSDFLGRNSDSPSRYTDFSSRSSGMGAPRDGSRRGDREGYSQRRQRD